MKRRTRIITAILVGLGVVGSAAAFHHPRWCHHGHGYWQSEHGAEEFVERMRDKLDLNEAQTASLKRLKEQLVMLREDFREGRQQQRAQIMDMITAPELDQRRALDILNQRITTMQQKAPDVIAAIAAFHDSLDLQQKQKVKAFMEDRFDHGRWHGSAAG